MMPTITLNPIMTTRPIIALVILLFALSAAFGSPPEVAYVIPPRIRKIKHTPTPT